MSDFKKDLEVLINKHSIDNSMDTPDFILSDYLTQCLSNLDFAIRQREIFFGRKPAFTVTDEKTI